MVIGISMVKDEADILDPVIRHMQTQVDHLIVADNGSTDGSREILEAAGVDIVDDRDPAYYQSRKMTALAVRAIDRGADWIVPFDADEVWVAADGRLGDTLQGLPPEAHIAEAALFDHVATGIDPDGANPIETTPWRRAAQAPLRKVAIRALRGATIHQGNHSAGFDGVPHPLTVTGQIEIRHFPYRSAEQFIKKARNGSAAYAATNLPEDAGGHWRGYGRILEEEGEAALSAVFRKWFYRHDPREEIVIDGERQPALVHDPCPLRS